MRIVVQKVTAASCAVAGQTISAIGRGYLLLVGLKDDDTIDDVRYTAKKIANLRIFEDDEGKLNKSIQDVGGKILSISQFTLYGDTAKGNRPSFTRAMRPEEANRLYQEFNRILRDDHQIPTQGGAFQQHMEISLKNDGPVTVIVESKER